MKALSPQSPQHRQASIALIAGFKYERRACYPSMEILELVSFMDLLHLMTNGHVRGTWATFVNEELNTATPSIQHCASLLQTAFAIEAHPPPAGVSVTTHQRQLSEIEKIVSLAAHSRRDGFATWAAAQAAVKAGDAIHNYP